MPHVPTTQPGPLEPTTDLVVRNTAQFETSWPQPATALVTAHGELDAANDTDFVTHTLTHAKEAERLVIDLTGLTFFSTEGFSALHTLNVECVGQQVRWALVPGPAVERVLRICDPDATLPVCADVDEALHIVHNDPPRLLHLVSEPR